jgi:hypothetical protein
MWMSRKAWSELTATVVRRYETEIIELKYTLEGLRAQRDRDLAAERVVVAGLRERLIDNEGRTRAALAMRDLMTIQINQLQDERGQFLQKLTDPSYRIGITIPKISSDPVVMPPGVDFEDMGDARAAQHGYSDHIPVDGKPVEDDDLTGLVGQVYDPASELGQPPSLLPDDQNLGPND